jgi:TM2 domain-containing membrane protein YozV
MWSTSPAIAPNGKSKLAAALFALFQGGLGIHEFYFGQVGWGIV